MSGICRRSWPSMSAISTTGARIVRSDNVHPARRGHARRIEATKLQSSSQYQCLEAFITSISWPHDLPDLFFAPHRRARLEPPLPQLVVPLLLASSNQHPPL